MYFHDFIGNISSTEAYRAEANVEAQYEPRFPICGGWRTDWHQGYNIPTKYNLKRDLTDPTQHTLTIDFLHNYDVLMTENYTIEFILPYGAKDFKVSFIQMILTLIIFQIEAPFDIDSQEYDTSIETLDFFGKPKLIVKKQNVFSYKHDQQIKVHYKFDDRMMLIKPLGLAITVFAFYLFAILSSRLSLSFMQ